MPAMLSVLTMVVLSTTCAMALAQPTTVPVDKPFLKKIDLFDGKTHGVNVYRIPGIVVTAKGTILAYGEARINIAADYGEIQTHLRRSTDGGRTWSKPVQIAHMAERIESNPTGKTGDAAKEQVAGNPCAIADRDGTVHFVYQVQYERAFYMRSDDDGVTFSQPVEITSAFDAFNKGKKWTVIATGPSHGIQLKSGRLLVPVWVSYGGARQTRAFGVGNDLQRQRRQDLAGG